MALCTHVAKHYYAARSLKRHNQTLWDYHHQMQSQKIFPSQTRTQRSARGIKIMRRMSSTVAMITAAGQRSLSGTCLPVSQLSDLEQRAVLREVICALLEWGYHESDGRFKMAA